MPLVGFVLIIMAAGTIITVLYFVTREKLEHEEWYIPPQPGSTPAVTATAQPGTTSVPSPVPSATPAAPPSDSEAKTE